MDDEYEIALLFSHENMPQFAGDNPCLRLKLYPVKILATGEIRNFVASSYGAGEPLADLQIRAQCDYASEQPYGWDVEYHDVFSVDLRRAKAMVKTLSKVERGHAKITSELGHPESFGAYVARTARIIRAKRFGWKASEGGGSLYSGNEYHWTDAAGMTNHVAEVVRKFKKSSEPVSS